MIITAPQHIWGAGPAGGLPLFSRPSSHGATGTPSKHRQVTCVAPCQCGGLKQSRISFFFFFGEMIKPGGGDRTSCKKPHPEQASPRLTVNKYSPLAALPSTVRALAPIVFQVQTGKGREEREMADRRFNLLLTAVFTGGALPIQQGCQQPGIAPGPHFFLLTFIIVLLWASPQLAYPRKRSGGSFPGLDKQPKSHRPAADRKAMGIRQGCSVHAATVAQPEGQRRGRWPGAAG